MITLLACGFVIALVVTAYEIRLGISAIDNHHLKEVIANLKEEKGN